MVLIISWRIVLIMCYSTSIIIIIISSSVSINASIYCMSLIQRKQTNMAQAKVHGETIDRGHTWWRIWQKDPLRMCWKILTLIPTILNMARILNKYKTAGITVDSSSNPFVIPLTKTIISSVVNIPMCLLNRRRLDCLLCIFLRNHAISVPFWTTRSAFNQKNMIHSHLSAQCVFIEIRYRDN